MKRYLNAIENPQIEKNIINIAKEYSTANSFSHFSFLNSLFNEMLSSILLEMVFLTAWGTGADNTLTVAGSKAL